jgi:membrane protease YdiL (CAAX protease family)
MTTITDSIKRHAVLVYFVLTFALSWGGLLLLTGGLGPMFGPDWRSDPRFMVGILAGPGAAAVAGLVLTGLTAGRAGYRDLRARLLRWRVGARWYAVALLLAPLSTLVVALLLARALGAPAFLPEIVTAQDPVGLLLPGIVTGLVVGFGEELGWTGFAIPRLRRRHGVLATGLLVGVVWGAWHFPAFRESGSFAAALPLTLVLVKLFSWLPAYRVLMVWVYDRTGSLLVPVLMHASATATTMILALPVLSAAQSLTSLLVWAGALWVVVAAVAAANGGRLARQPLRRRAA